MNTQAPDKPTIEALFKEHDIRRVKLGGFDIDGVLRGKFVSLEKFWSIADSGFGFCDVIFGWDVADQLYDNGGVTGWQSGFPDVLAKVDLATFRVLPSEPHVAHFLIDFYSDQKHAHPACPRNLLKNTIARLGAAGFSAKVGFELEYWIFKEDSDSLQHKGFSDLTPLTPGMYGYSWVRTGQQAELMASLMDELAAFDINIESMHTETGPGVYETALRYSDPLRAADMAALFKSVMKVLCARRGLAVTFMAKWNSQLPGSSGHIHQSLWSNDGEQNLFADGTDPQGLSDMARHYVGGLCKLSPALTAVFAPTVNSYKRYVPGMWAPMTATWGIENRTSSIRIIGNGGRPSTRVEFRQPAADLNPYTALSACLGAGLHGVTQAVAPPGISTGDATTADDAPALPTSLASAIAAMHTHPEVREVLPEAFVDHYLRTRDFELRESQKAVTNWELARYFESI